MKYNSKLDSLRALAALSVIAYHYTLFPCGWIGVQLFFVLSGFLISGIVIKGKASYEYSKTEFFKHFYVRRLRRLFPLYFGYLVLLSLVFIFFRQPKVFGVEWPWLFTYTLNFRWLAASYTFHAFYGHLWSLALEWQFYLFWPFLLWAIPEKKVKFFLFCLLPLSLMLRYLGYFICQQMPMLIPYNGTLTDKALSAYVLPLAHLDAFVLGAFLCFKEIRAFLSRKSVVIGTIVLTFSVGLLLIYCYPNSYDIRSLGWPNKMPFAYQWLWGYLLLNLASAVLIAAILERDYLFLRITEWKVLQYLGKISYGIYVFHSAVVFAVQTIMKKISLPGKDMIGLLSVIAITVFIASLSFTYWEQLFLKKKLE